MAALRTLLSECRCFGSSQGEQPQTCLRLLPRFSLRRVRVVTATEFGHWHSAKRRGRLWQRLAVKAASYAPSAEHPVLQAKEPVSASSVKALSVSPGVPCWQWHWQRFLLAGS